MWGYSTVGRTKFSDVRPTLKAVNGESAQNSPGIFGALAQLVARYIRIVEVTGSNPVCSTMNPAFRCRIFCFIPLFLQVYFTKTAGL